VIEVFSVGGDDCASGVDGDGKSLGEPVELIFVSFPGDTSVDRDIEMSGIVPLIDGVTVSVLPEVFSKSLSVDKPEKEVVRVSIVGEEGGDDEEVEIEVDEGEVSVSSYFFFWFNRFFISS